MHATATREIKWFRNEETGKKFDEGKFDWVTFTRIICCDLSIKMCWVQQISPTNAQIKIYLVAVRTHSIHCIVFSCCWSFLRWDMTDLEAGLSATGDTNDAAHLTSNRRTEAEARRGGHRSSQKLFFFHLSSLASLLWTKRAANNWPLFLSHYLKYHPQGNIGCCHKFEC